MNYMKFQLNNNIKSNTAIAVSTLYHIRISYTWNSFWPELLPDQTFVKAKMEAHRIDLFKHRHRTIQNIKTKAW